MAGKFRTVLDWWDRAQSIHDVWNFIWPWIPIGWGFATGGAGYWTHQPVMQIMTYTAASAAFGFVALLAVMVILERKNPENKLTYVAPMVGVELAKQRNQNTAKRIEKAQWWFQIRNDANFPISLIVYDAQTDVEDMQPPRVKYPKAPVYIGPRGTINVMDEPVLLNGRVAGNFTGHAEITLRYGNRGNEKYELKIAGDLQAVMMPNGSVTSVILSHTI